MGEYPSVEGEARAWFIPPTASVCPAVTPGQEDMALAKVLEVKGGGCSGPLQEWIWGPAEAYGGQGVGGC